MVARGAMWNPSIFEPETKPVIAMVLEYLDIAATYDNHFSNSKYVVQEMLKGHLSKHPHFNAALAAAKDVRTLRTAVETIGAAPDLPTVTTAAGYLPPVILGERPWDLDPSVPVIPEFDAAGMPVSVSVNKAAFRPPRAAGARPQKKQKSGNGAATAAAAAMAAAPDGHEEQDDEADEAAAP